MNKQRRKEVQGIIQQITDFETKFAEAMAIIDSLSLEDIEAAVEVVRDEEQESFDNLPESFQSGERGETITKNVNQLEEALSALQEAKNIFEQIQEIEGFLENAEGALDNAQN